MDPRRRCFGRPSCGYGRALVSGDIDPDHDFSVVTSSADGVAFVTVSGQADLHTAPELRSAISTVIDGGIRSLAIDLSDATFIDSMTLGVLLGALKRLTPLGGKLVIVCPGQHVRRVFEITSLDRVLALVETPDEAREWLAGATTHRHA